MRNRKRTSPDLAAYGTVRNLSADKKRWVSRVEPPARGWPGKKWIETRGWVIVLLYQYMEVSINGGTPKMMVYKGKSIYIWMIWGYPYFRKPPYMCIPKYVIYIHDRQIHQQPWKVSNKRNNNSRQKSGVVHTKLNHLAASSNTDTLWYTAYVYIFVIMFHMFHKRIRESANRKTR